MRFNQVMRAEQRASVCGPGVPEYQTGLGTGLRKWKSHLQLSWGPGKLGPRRPPSRPLLEDQSAVTRTGDQGVRQGNVCGSRATLRSWAMGSGTERRAGTQGHLPRGTSSCLSISQGPSSTPPASLDHPFALPSCLSARHPPLPDPLSVLPNSLCLASPWTPATLGL